MRKRRKDTTCALRAIWADPLALLDGTPSFAELPAVWMELGPPLVLSLLRNGSETHALYCRLKHARPDGLLALRAGWKPLALFLLGPPRSPLVWCSDDSLKDLDCLLQAFGLPGQCMLVFNDRIVDCIGITCRPVPAVAQLLLLSTETSATRY